jgi:6-phosphogluconolactonase
LAIGAGQYVLDCATRAVEATGRFTIALSGGKSPAAMFEFLAHHAMPWSRTVIYQVDERVVAPTDPARNVLMLRQAFAAVPADIRAMPVDDSDLQGAAARYGGELPEFFDLVHLGLGPDGHTASLAPNDPVLEVYDRPVALTDPYLGHRRMTLTYPTLNRAHQLLWLVSGDDKRHALDMLLRNDPSIPAGRVQSVASIIMSSVAASA